VGGGGEGTHAGPHSLHSHCNSVFPSNNTRSHVKCPMFLNDINTD